MPRKNVRPIAGLPLIAYAIRAAQAVKGISRVIVSTDDDEIAAVAQEHGALVPFMRPATLATDTAPEWMAWRHALGEAEKLFGASDAFVSVPAVCPLRTSSDIERCLQTFRAETADIVVTVVPARANPYYTLVELGTDGQPHLCKQPPAILTGRQQAPQVLQIVAGCYVATPAYVMKASSIWEGKLRTVEIPEEHGVDIDTEVDFLLAETLLRRRQAAELAAGR